MSTFIIERGICRVVGEREPPPPPVVSDLAAADRVRERVERERKRQHLRFRRLGAKGAKP